MDVSLSPYTVLGLPPNATAKEINKAYKLKALQLHPDKNPDNVHAKEEFLKVTAAYDILKDEKAKQAYDAVEQVRQENKRKRDKEDEGMKAMKKSLFEREEAARTQAMRMKNAEEELKRQMERLRKETEIRAKEMRDMIAERQKTPMKPQYSAAERTLILKYKKKDEWTSEKIAALLETEAVAIAFTPGKSIVEFDRIDDAYRIYSRNIPGIKATWLTGEEPDIRLPMKIPTSTQDYESSTLLRMQAASQRIKEQDALRASLLEEEQNI